VLPNPRLWSPARPDAYIAERADSIEARLDRAQGDFACLR
jgi:hypothetical protein